MSCESRDLDGTYRSKCHVYILPCSVVVYSADELGNCAVLYGFNSLWGRNFATRD